MQPTRRSSWATGSGRSYTAFAGTFGFGSEGMSFPTSSHWSRLGPWVLFAASSLPPQSHPCPPHAMAGHGRNEREGRNRHARGSSSSKQDEREGDDGREEA